MPRRPRFDRPGSWHDVVNRALGKRPYFETRRDKRQFMARLACQIRRGRLEVHSYCLMSTHFHMLVCSPKGELSEALRQIQNSYARYFNRTRDRDGPLVKSRFYSKRVDSDEYRRIVIGYIDANPVTAGMVPQAWDFEFGSARAWIRGDRQPWLSDRWIPQRVADWTHADGFSPEGYLRVFGEWSADELSQLGELVEFRLEQAGLEEPHTGLVDEAPASVLAWLQQRAALADGQVLGLAACGPTAVERAVQSRVLAVGDWILGADTAVLRGSLVARVGLLQSLCQLSELRLQQRTGLSRWNVRKAAHLHRTELVKGSEHAVHCAAIASKVMGPLTLPGGLQVGQARAGVVRHSLLSK